MNSEISEQEFDPFAKEPEKKQKEGRSGAGIAWLALLLALVAAGSSAYRWWLDYQAGSEQADAQALVQSLQQAQEDLGNSLESLRSRLNTVEQDDSSAEFAALESEMNVLRGRISDIGLRVADGQAAITALETSVLGIDERVTAAESGIAALASRGDTPAKKLDLSEVESLLRMASEHLQIFGDVRSADQALALADARLAAMEDPLYLSVRQRIARAQQSLAEVPAPDMVALSNRVTNLQFAIPTLPFAGEYRVAEQPQEDNADGSLWERFKSTLSGLVTVRRKVPEDDLMLSLEDKDYIRQGLWLQLESARLALMRSDAAVYDRSLERAAETMAARFDPVAPHVTAAVEQLDELREVRFAGDMPDISSAWAQLRLLREGRGDEQDEAVDATATAEEPAQQSTAEDDGG